MKKSLISLAAIAASGIAFADVTVTGTLAMGYRAGSYLTVNGGATNGIAVGDPRTGNTLVSKMAAPGGVTSADSSGFGVDTSEIVFGFSEDLGGGTRIIGKMTIEGADRSAANPASLWSGATSPTLVPTAAGTVTGGDALLTLVGSMGAVTLATIRNPDYVTGAVGGTAQVGGVDMSGKVTLGRSIRDSVAYTVKVASDWTIQLSQAEASALPGMAVPTSVGVPLGLGVGSSGAATAVNQRQTGLGITYVGGAWVVNGQYQSSDNRTLTADASVADVYRLSGNYNFGVAKVGAAVEVDNSAAGGKLQMMNLVVAVPMGALKLSANVTSFQASDLLNAIGPAATRVLALQNGTKTGYGLAAEYALSKRTSLIANYASWDQTIGAVSRNSESNLLLSHKF